MKSLKEIAKNTVLTENQLHEIEKIILKQGSFSPESVREEIDWFCTGLGMAEYYFRTTPIKTIADHIAAIKAAEVLASIRKEEQIKIDLATELKNEAIYLVDDHHTRAIDLERRIESKYPNYRLQSYRTLGKAFGTDHLRMYVVYKPKFKTDKLLPEETNLDKISCQEFLKNATSFTRQRYQNILTRASGWETPLIDISEKKKTNETRIMVVTNRDSSSRFFTNVSDVFNSHNLVTNRKYQEQFANGKTVYAFYLDKIQDEDLLQNIIEDISLVYVIPESPLMPLFREGKLTTQETVFGVAAWSYTHQFLSRYNEEYVKLSDELKDSPELQGILRNLKTRLAKETYDESRVWEALVKNYKFIKKAFKLFDKKFYVGSKNHNITFPLNKLREEIRQTITIEIGRNILFSILQFIEVIYKTNFYKSEKTSLAFMYDPVFLNPVDYPEKPFGIFHIIGIEFRGFHIRFRDIARGGIRIVRSVNYQNYLNNSDFIFDENYNLAYTQQKKNKDIPEGGSKGAILMRWNYQDKPKAAFKKYINGLLDLMLPDEKILDYYNKEVILFLGPDEGTAELMEWATLRAKSLGYTYWKAFATGKPVTMGGIPHDLYGMTTNSVHQYVINILKKVGVPESNITKVMTGGPDGDLGSNEIFISKDKIIALIDGSGVLYDPEGLDRKELEKLAKVRKMVENYPKSQLSPQGFLVTLNDHDIQLPTGEKILKGMEFRNTFHLHPLFKADLFVPCGGRPESININNWKLFIDKNGIPRFKYIVEGANLFITQQARLRLEEKGIIIYKDASANKGGVTSSSLEVFASLALTDEEFAQWMCVKDGKIPDFRKQYVREILQIIRENAAQEFEIIWLENQRKKIFRSILTDMISNKINSIGDSIYTSDLPSNKNLFRSVIQYYCPPVLVQKVGIEKIMKRVPESYLKAIFASRLASQYVYKFGLDAGEIDFFNFIKDYKI
ncbi:MAG: NAD-glutamate dehydrogenase [Candidatus Aminicenantes bacterium]|nr:NAD-glutamate dehydrogenase [Candidatus Aminicenantes bacterium]